MLIRELDLDSDLDSLRRCTIELQNYLRPMCPRMPEGEQIVNDYVPKILNRCKKYQGKIYVADENGCVIGYAMVLTKMKSKELDSGNYEYGLIADLFVQADRRNMGVGRKLLSKAEEYAKECNVKWLRIGVLDKNVKAKKLYLDSGFNNFFVEMEKDLE